MNILDLLDTTKVVNEVIIGLIIAFFGIVGWSINEWIIKPNKEKKNISTGLLLEIEANQTMFMGVRLRDES